MNYNNVRERINTRRTNSLRRGAKDSIFRAIEKPQSLYAWSQIAFRHNDYYDILFLQSWKQLKSLHLFCCQVTDSKLTQVASLEWQNLEILDLGSNRLTSKGVKNLLIKQWTDLGQLYLSDNEEGIGDDGMISLITTQSLPNLRILFLTNNKISEVGLRSIPNTNLNKMRILELNRNPIGSRGVSLLIKADFPRLKVLQLGWCNIGTEGSKHLCKGKWMYLYILRVYYNKINFDGYLTLLENNWPKMASLYVWDLPAISYMLLSTPNWKLNCSIYSQIPNPQLKQQTQKVLNRKYKYTQ